MKPVLCYGDICPDLIIPYGASLDLRDGTDIDPEQLSVQVSHGGSVANTCVGIARQGVPTLFCGTVGNDGYGRMLYDGLVSEGVDVSMFRKDDDCRTVLVLIVMDQSGERMTFACPRRHASQHSIRKDQLPDGIEERIGWLHCAGITLREPPACDVQLDLMRRCRKAGVPVSLDVNVRVESIKDPIFTENIRQAAELCTVLLGSAADEIAPFAGTKDPVAAACSLVRANRVVIARDGAHGASVYTEQGTFHQDAFPVTVKDAVGAGDAYNAGFVAAQMKGLSPAESNRMACATAAFCVTGDGGRATPTTEQLTAFLHHYPAASQ